MVTGVEAAVTDRATALANNVASNVSNTASNMASSAASGIGGFIRNLFMAPIDTLANFGSGAFNGVMSGGLLGACIGVGTILFAPDIIRPVCRLLGHEEWADRLTSREMSTPALLATGAGLGAGAAAGAGAISSVVRGLTSNGVGGFIGGAGTLVGIGALIYGSMNSDGSIRRDASGDNNVTPPPAPRRVASNENNTANVRVN